MTRFENAFNLATKATAYQGGRAAVQLPKAFFLGHACNLNLVAVQALLRAASKWKRFSADRAESLNPGQVKELKKVLVPLGVDVQPNALQLPNGNAWTFFSGSDTLERFLHELRQLWRMQELNAWLKSSRRDAVMARAEGVLLLWSLAA